MQRLGCFLQRFVSAPRSTKEPAPAAQVFAQLIHMISACASRGQVRDHDLVHQRGWHELASLKVGGSIGERSVEVSVADPTLQYSRSCTSHTTKLRRRGSNPGVMNSQHSARQVNCLFKRTYMSAFLSWPKTAGYPGACCMHGPRKC